MRSAFLRGMRPHPIFTRTPYGGAREHHGKKHARHDRIFNRTLSHRAVETALVPDIAKANHLMLPPSSV